MRLSAYSNAILAVIGCTLLAACSGGDLLVGSASSGGNGGGAGEDETQPPNVLAAAKCDFSAPTPRAALTGTCKDGWCWENSTPTGAATRLASPPEDNSATAPLFAWSKHQLLSLQNDQWVQHSLPAFGEIWSAYARSRNDIWLSTFDASGFGYSLAMFHFDGTGWSATPDPPCLVGNLQAATDGSLWGYCGQMVRLDGTSWTLIEQPPPATDDDFVEDYRPVSAHELWRVRTSTLEHYVDGAWTSFVIPDASGEDFNNSLLSLQVMADGSVWVAGYAREFIENTRHNLFIESDRRSKGLLLRFDGTTFSKIELPDFGGIRALFGTPSDLWLGSTDGEMLHYDGQSFSAIEATPHDTAAFAKRGDTLWALAADSRGTGGIARWDGQAWSEYAPIPTVETITSIWGSAFDDVWAVGTNGLRLHFDGVSWRNTGAASGGDDYSAVWGASRDSVYTVAKTGLHHFDGQRWRRVAEADLAGGSISGIADDDLWIARSQLYHYDGKTLESFEPPPFESGSPWPQDAKSVVAFSDRDVWIATGDDVLRFDGTTWTSMGVRGWKLWGRSATDVWTLIEGTWPETENDLVHFDGKSWTTVPRPSGSNIYIRFAADGLSFGGCDQYFWVTDSNRLNVFDGTTWTTSYQDGPYQAAVWGLSPDALIAGGLRGGIMRKTRMP